jgi:hypothetical protein
MVSDGNGVYKIDTQLYTQPCLKTTLKHWSFLDTWTRFQESVTPLSGLELMTSLPRFRDS